MPNVMRKFFVSQHVFTERHTVVSRNTDGSFECPLQCEAQVFSRFKYIPFVIKKNSEVIMHYINNKCDNKYI